MDIYAIRDVDASDLGRPTERRVSSLSVSNSGEVKCGSSLLQGVDQGDLDEDQ